MKDGKPYLGFAPSQRMFDEFNAVAAKHGLKRSVVLRRALRLALDSPRLDRLLEATKKEQE